MESTKLDDYFAHYQHLMRTVISLQTYKNRTDVVVKEKDIEIDDYKHKIESLNSEIAKLKANNDILQKQCIDKQSYEKDSFEKY